jgi:hypothetical protein
MNGRALFLLLLLSDGGGELCIEAGEGWGWFLWLFC